MSLKFSMIRLNKRQMFGSYGAFVLNRINVFCSVGATHY
jgi:hypothetical protein